MKSNRLTVRKQWKIAWPQFWESCFNFKDVTVNGNKTQVRILATMVYISRLIVVISEKYIENECKHGGKEFEDKRLSIRVYNAKVLVAAKNSLVVTGVKKEMIVVEEQTEIFFRVELIANYFCWILVFRQDMNFQDIQLSGDSLVTSGMETAYLVMTVLVVAKNGLIETGKNKKMIVGIE